MYGVALQSYSATVTGNLVGGPTVGAANVIAGNQYSGVYIQGGGTTGNVIQGNLIGTDAAGAARGNGDYGVILLGGASGNVIGGTGAGESNHIAFNGSAGVGVQDPTTTRDRIRGNSIHDNGGLGIDLIGVSANDPGDSDTGANQFQNYPVIASAQGGSTTRVIGALRQLGEYNNRPRLLCQPDGRPLRLR